VSKGQNAKHKIMEVAMLWVMVPIIMIISIVIMVIYIRRFVNQERMAMIDKGVNPEIFANTNKGLDVSITLRFALLLIGMGLGLLMGYSLDRAFDMEEVGYFSMLLIFGGVGLGLAYLIEERKAKKPR
jgi:hypothetical protein